MGWVGGDGDVKAVVDQHSALLGRLVEDRSLGSTLLGSFPGADSSQTLRREDGDFYLAGVLTTKSVASTRPSASGDIYALPIYLGVGSLLDKLMVEVTALEAGKNARIGIYTDTGDVYPDRLIYGSGEVSVGTTGFKEAQTAGERTARGLSWLAMTANTTVPPGAQFRSVESTQAGTWIILGYSSTIPDVAYCAWRKPTTYGPLPDVFPLGAFKDAISPAIWVSLKPGGWS